MPGPFDDGPMAPSPRRYPPTRPAPRRTIPLSAEVRPRPRPGGRSAGRHARHRPRRASRLRSSVRGVSGSFAAGLLVLALGLVVVHFWVVSRGQQGPGAVSVACQLIAAVLAVALQRVADRRSDGTGTAALLGVFALGLGSLWFWWWL